MKTIYFSATVHDDIISDWNTLLLAREGKIGISYDFNIVTLPTEEEIENGVTEIAKKNAKTSVGDYAVGYIAGAKAVINKIKEQ